MATHDDDAKAGAGLPRVVALAWGMPDRSRPGPKPGLTLGRIVAAAVAIADADGLAALSMARLAKELGFTTMSLYRYVASKDELLVVLVDGALGPPPPSGDGLEWRPGLDAWARAQRAAFRKHSWALDIPISGPPVAPNQIAWLEQGLRPFADSGLPEAEKLSTMLLVSGFVRATSILERDLRRGQATPGAFAGDVTAFESVLAGLIDAQRFPALAHAVAEGGFAAEDLDFDFEYGLARILDGVEARLVQRPTKSRKR